MKRFLIIWAVFTLTFGLTGGKRLTGVRAENWDAAAGKPELVMQTGHNKTVSAVVFSPDNKWIASGSLDNSIKIWEAETGRELRVFSGHDGAVKTLAWSADGKWLVSGGNDKTVKLWNVEAGRVERSFTGYNQPVETVVFRQDGRMIASAGGDQTIKIWDAATGSEWKSLADGSYLITALAFSPDGQFLAAGNADNSIKIWEINKDKKPRILKNHTDRVKTLAFSPDGQFLASGAFDNTVRIWKTSNGRESYKFTGHADKILSLKFLSPGEIVSTDIKHNIKFWNPAGGAETRKTIKEIEKDEFTEAESAAFSSDGAAAVFGYGDRSASMFETAAGKQISKMENHIVGLTSLTFSSDRKWLAVAGLDNTIKLWDLQTGLSLPPLAGHNGFVRSVAFTPDNRQIVSGSLDDTIKIWNFTTGAPPETLGKHSGGVNSIAVSRRGKFLVSGSVDKTVKIWDLNARKELGTLPEHGGEVNSVAISPDEKLIASASVDKTVKIWDLSAQKEIKTFSDYTDSVESIAFSPDGKLLASASADKIIKIRDVASGQILSTFSDHTGKITAVSFSPDGKWIVSSGDDKIIRFRRVSGERAEKTLEEASAVKSVNFSPDGKWLASAGEDGSVNIWQTETASKLATLLSLRENDDWLVVSPGGFFDGSPAAWNQLLWRFAGDTFNFSPVEIFYNEFFQPGLLAKLLTGEQLDATGDISRKDRRQPKLKISLADGKIPGDKIADREIRLKIEIAENTSENSPTKGSGAKDVRLFRNGSLVRFWGGDVLAGKSGKTTLEATVPIVEGQNEFTAYAFNYDDIKSSDESLIVTGAENLRRKGTIYIFAVGIGKYANPAFNLSYIESDVKLFGEVLRIKQSEINSGDRIKVLPLLDENATKSNILETLKALAGKSEIASALPFPEQPRKVEPEDTVIVYFSGHGVAIDNRFYMIPYDLGYAGKRSELYEERFKELTRNFVSDQELEEAFRGVDARNLLLIVDACNSGQALESKEKRQGPMNSKGLGQLAQDKGIYILTASQREEEAYVSSTLKHSYLTYALVEEGLKSAKADNKPADGQLVLREWFDYAETRVPQLRQESVDAEEAKGFERKSKDQEKPAAAADKTKPETSAAAGQRPRVFYRRQIERQPLVVARFSVAKQ